MGLQKSLDTTELPDKNNVQRDGWFTPPKASKFPKGFGKAFLKAR